VGKGKQRVLFKIPSLKRAGELLNLGRQQVKILTGLLTGHRHLKGHLFKLGKQWQIVPCVLDASRHLKQSHTFFVTVALATLRFRHLGCHFLKPCNFQDSSASKILHFVQSPEPLTE